MTPESALSAAAAALIPFGITDGTYAGIRYTLVAKNYTFATPMLLPTVAIVTENGSWLGVVQFTSTGEPCVRLVLMDWLMQGGSLCSN